MSGTLPQRPAFSDGQYIGAAELNNAITYARDETRRLALSGGSWGIATGLALVEIPNTTGGVEMFIEPGIAWDGYGRPVVLFTPAPVTPDLFASLPSGNQAVWLRYTATGAQAVSAGFRTCGGGDPFTSIAESFVVEAGSPTAAQRTAGVIIGGATVPDPRDMLVAVDANAAIILDGSAPHQTFPVDSAVWLIPVGIAAYNAGAPGSFSARSATQLALSRAARTYIGAIAESVLAADGILRLRDRQTDNTDTDANLAAQAAIQPGDIAADPNNLNRLIGNELVWVEGNLRVTGHARLFGTQLELRDATGQTAGVPQFLRRATPASNPLGGQDLQICFDQPGDATGINRLTFGVAPAGSGPPSSAKPDGPLTELMVLRADGRAALGTNAIDDYNASANQLVVATKADTGISIASGPTAKGNLYFADGANKTQQMDGFLSYDHKTRALALGAAAGTVMTLTAAGQAVIGPADPLKFAPNASQLIVSDSNDGPAGISISGGNLGSATIDFTDDTSPPNDGFIQYTAAAGFMQFGTKSATRMVIDAAGNVGIGTAAPGAALHVRGQVPGAAITALMLDAPSLPTFPVLQFAQGGAVLSALYVANGVTTLESAGLPAWSAAGAHVGIGASGNLRATLDVCGAPPPGVTEQSHVAVVQNLSPLPGNVLALRSSAGIVTGGNFISFLDGADNLIGAVEGTQVFNWSTFSMQNSIMFNAYAAADYAEAVIRVAGEAPLPAGSVVGVRNGQVSRVTDGADCLFVTTDRPAMLGNAPPKAQRGAYEMLAFIGQVPVLVAGPVQPGDIIIASGRADGAGRAVKPGNIQPHELALIVGQAWAAIKPDPAHPDTPRRVNALVGPGAASAAATGALLARQAHLLAAQEKLLAAQAAALERLSRRRKPAARA
jgi:hypothetical protein